jgi:hypothetical protein
MPRGAHVGEAARALGDALRERGHRAEVDAVTGTAITELAPAIGVRAACDAAGAAQASSAGGTGTARPRRGQRRSGTATVPSPGR